MFLVVWSTYGGSAMCFTYEICGLVDVNLYIIMIMTFLETS